MIVYYHLFLLLVPLVSSQNVTVPPTTATDEAKTVTVGDYLTVTVPAQETVGSTPDLNRTESFADLKETIANTTVHTDFLKNDTASQQSLSTEDAKDTTVGYFDVTSEANVNDSPRIAESRSFSVHSDEIDDGDEELASSSSQPPNEYVMKPHKIKKKVLVSRPKSSTEKIVLSTDKWDIPNEGKLNESKDLDESTESNSIQKISKKRTEEPTRSSDSQTRKFRFPESRRSSTERYDIQLTTSSLLLSSIQTLISNNFLSGIDTTTRSSNDDDTESSKDPIPAKNAIKFDADDFGTTGQSDWVPLVSEKGSNEGWSPIASFSRTTVHPVRSKQNETLEDFMNVTTKRPLSSSMQTIVVVDLPSTPSSETSKEESNNKVTDMELPPGSASWALASSLFTRIENSTVAPKRTHSPIIQALNNTLQRKIKENVLVLSAPTEEVQNVTKEYNQVLKNTIPDSVVVETTPSPKWHSGTTSSLRSTVKQYIPVEVTPGESYSSEEAYSKLASSSAFEILKITTSPSVFKSSEEFAKENLLEKLSTASSESPAVNFVEVATENTAKVTESNEIPVTAFDSVPITTFYPTPKPDILLSTSSAKVDTTPSNTVLPVTEEARYTETETPPKTDLPVMFFTTIPSKATTEATEPSKMVTFTTTETSPSTSKTTIGLPKSEIFTTTVRPTPPRQSTTTLIPSKPDVYTTEQYIPSRTTKNMVIFTTTEETTTHAGTDVDYNVSAVKEPLDTSVNATNEFTEIKLTTQQEPEVTTPKVILPTVKTTVKPLVETTTVKNTPKIVPETTTEEFDGGFIHTESAAVFGIEGVTSQEDERTDDENRTIVVNGTDTDEITEENVPAYLRLTVQTSEIELCHRLPELHTAILKMLSEGTNTNVSAESIVLLNLNPHLCKPVLRDVRPEDVDVRLRPVNMFLMDADGGFNKNLSEVFLTLWGHAGLDFPLPILKVDFVTPIVGGEMGATVSSGVVAAIVISTVAGICLILLGILFVIMKRRQKKFNYGTRCTPVSLDAYSLDSVSIRNSGRRKNIRASKRSYGNAAFDDPEITSHALNFAGLANFSLEKNQIHQEFAVIPQVSPRVDEYPPGVEAKNRYANVIPLPETRVVLPSRGNDPLSDYINANFVRGYNNAEKTYIAAQAPLESTLPDWWRMVWEQQVKVILMLTALSENGVDKCADYLPPSEVTDSIRMFGDFQVTLKKRDVKEKYIVSTVQLKNMETNLWREVSHLWYLGWPDSGVPSEPNSLIAFLIEARSQMKTSSGSPVPTLVHCSPGTGRTGTVIACDVCIREFEQNRVVDIPKCVYHMRRARAGAVQTRDQYAFIYQVLNAYATKLTGGALENI